MRGMRVLIFLVLLTLASITAVSAYDNFTFRIDLVKVSDMTAAFYTNDAALSIDWGDGNSENFTGTGNVSHLYADGRYYDIVLNGSATRLSFYEGTPRAVVDIKTNLTPGITGITNASHMFHYVSNRYFTITEPAYFDDISANITDMSYMFYGCSNNDNLSSWDVSNVLDMSHMFYSNIYLDQDLSMWNVSNVKNMSYMFRNSDYNWDLDGWDVSNVRDMNQMFMLNNEFNGSLASWDVGNVLDMSSMFYGSIDFNRDISSWNVRNVRDMSKMFYAANDFNQNLSAWDVGNVTNMTSMFWNSDFSGDLSTWNVGSVQDMTGMFSSVTNFNSDLSSWDVSKVKDMGSMFSGATNFNGDVSTWDVSSVTNMRYMFYNSDFNRNISNWDVSNVLYMDRMFFNVDGFNQDISNWDVGNVTNMEGMFDGASNFNQDISSWDVSKVTDMRQMFEGLSSFNQDISLWDVGNVTDMGYMFYNAYSFNQDVSGWNVGNVTDMRLMFYNANNFSQNLSTWNVSSVTNMTQMFNGASKFNGNISDWDVGNVLDMNGIFSSAVAFNQDISGWDVSKVKNMGGMFYSTDIFNQDISGWNVSSATDMNSMFFSASVFNQDLTFWNTINVQTMLNMFRDAISFSGDISGWDTSNVTNMAGMFYGALNFNSNLSDWDVGNVTDMSQMFYDASSFNGNVSNWDTGNVIDMGSMFYNANNFNQDISAWNVGHVTDMSYMFRYAENFNSDMSNWNVANVTDMSYMFNNASSFNSNLSNWDTSNVLDMSYLFHSASSFNGDLSGWDVSNINNMFAFFRGASNFNQNLSSWNVSNVTNMGQMFFLAFDFNGDVSTWDVSGVTDMSWMFYNASSFNQDLSSWDVGNVTNMEGMFCNVSAFNQDISGWNVRGVTDMAGMFLNALSFDQNLSSWDVRDVTDMTGMFRYLTLSTANYDSLLIGWAGLPLESGVEFDGGNSKYNAGQTARDTILIGTYGWTIFDGGFCDVTNGSTYNCTGCSDCNTALNNGSYATVKLMNDINENGTCINITQNNVAFDCQNYTISGASVTDTYGIFVEGDYVTLRNCTVQYYENGIYATEADNILMNNIESRVNNNRAIYVVDSIGGEFYNILAVGSYHGLDLYNPTRNPSSARIVNFTAYNNQFYGLALNEANENYLKNISSSYNGNAGIYTRDADSNVIDNAYTSGNGGYTGGKGVVLGGGSDWNNISNVWAHDNGREGVYLVAASYNRISNVTANGSLQANVALSSSANHNMLYNLTSEDTQLYGVSIGGSHDNNLSLVTISGSPWGLYIEMSERNYISDVQTYENRDYGIIFSGESYNNMIENVSAWENGEHGIYVRSTEQSGLVHPMGHNTLREVSVWNNGEDGVNIEGAYSIIFENVMSWNNSRDGFVIVTVESITEESSLAAANNNITNITSWNNRGYGFVLNATINNTINNSNSYNNTRGALRIFLADESFCGGGSNVCGNDIIYNNIFNGSIIFETLSGNEKWNTTNQSGPNIVNGLRTGGNYYTNAQGNGYSDICGDEDSDGYCDSSYTIGMSNIDFLPLAIAPKDTDGDGIPDQTDIDDDDDGIEDTIDTINGNESNIITNISIEIIVNDSTNISIPFNDTYTVQIKDTDRNITIIEFNNSFNETRLDFFNVIIREGELKNSGSMLIYGIHPSSTKTIIFEQKNTTTEGICIFDETILDINIFTNNCRGDFETYIECDNVIHGAYTCEILNISNTKYLKVSGLTNSAVKQQCQEDWSCTAWSTCVSSTQTRTCTDTNACGTQQDKPSQSQSCNSGGSGGGSSRSSTPSTFGGEGEGPPLLLVDAPAIYNFKIIFKEGQNAQAYFRAEIASMTTTMRQSLQEFNKEYRTYKIVLNTDKNIAESATYNIRVPNTWLSENNIDPDSIQVLIQTQNDIQTHTLKQTDSDIGFTMYEAKTPIPEYITIIGESVPTVWTPPPQEEQPQQIQPQKEEEQEQKEQEQEDKTAPPPEKIKPKDNTFLIIFVITILVLGGSYGYVQYKKSGIHIEPTAMTSEISPGLVFEKLNQIRHKFNAESTTALQQQLEDAKKDIELTDQRYKDIFLEDIDELQKDFNSRNLKSNMQMPYPYNTKDTIYGMLSRAEKCFSLGDKNISHKYYMQARELYPMLEAQDQRMVYTAMMNIFNKIR